MVYVYDTVMRSLLQFTMSVDCVVPRAFYHFVRHLVDIPLFLLTLISKTVAVWGQ